MQYIYKWGATKQGKEIKCVQTELAGLPLNTKSKVLDKQSHGVLPSCKPDVFGTKQCCLVFTVNNVWLQSYMQ